MRFFHTAHKETNEIPPFGIFWRMLKMGLDLMRGLALKKCMAGGDSAPDNSFCFIFNRRASSRCSASLSTICPPVCMEASRWIRASLWRGSGEVRTAVRRYKSRQTTAAAWGRCIIAATYR